MIERMEKSICSIFLYFDHEESFLIFFIVKDCLKCGKEYGIITEHIFG